MPLPREELTPPVTKTYLQVDIRFVVTGRKGSVLISVRSGVLKINWKKVDCALVPGQGNVLSEKFLLAFSSERRY